MISKKAQHSSIVFLLLFVSIVSIFTTISVLQQKTDIPTGLVVDDDVQQDIVEQKASLEQTSYEPNTDCSSKTSWFRRFTCNIGLEHWFYKEVQTTTVYTVDEDGNVVDAVVLTGDESPSNMVPIGRGDQ